MPLHKNIARISNISAVGGYQKTRISQYSASINTVSGGVYEVIAHTEYLSYGSESIGELDLQLEVGGSIIAKSTMTGAPLTQTSRTLVGEFTATSTTTSLETSVVSSIARNINIYQGYLRIMRVG